jgi:hypothetical protein
MRTETRLGWIGILAFVTALGCAAERRDDALDEAALADTPADPLRCVADHPPVVSVPDGHGGLVAAWGAAEARGTFVVRRLDANCATVWEYRREDAVDRYPAALAVTADDRVLVGGAEMRADQPLIRGVRRGNAILLAALDAAGALAWEKDISGLGRVDRLVPAPNGDIVALGRFDSPIDLGGGVLQDSTQDVSTFLVRYDATGRFLWNKVLGDRSNLRVTAVTVADDGSVTVVGRLHDFDFGGGPLHAPQPAPGDERGPEEFKVVYDAWGHLVASSLAPRLHHPYR